MASEAGNVPVDDRAVEAARARLAANVQHPAVVVTVKWQEASDAGPDSNRHQRWPYGPTPPYPSRYTAAETP